MKKTFLLTLIFLMGLTATAWTQQNSQIFTLKDGSTVKGQLLNVTNGIYTIESPLMGQIKIPIDQVINISAAGYQPQQNVAISTNGQISASTINSVKTSIMEDPQIMSLIQDLIKDPEVAEIMKNPSLLQDALSMDPQRIQNNPDVQKLMQNPAMQKILNITAQKLQNNPSGL